jgi:translation initiation factor 5A
MASEDVEEFTSTDAGSSNCTPCIAGDLKKGDMVMIKGHPCKISDISFSKTGKHGHAKANMTAYDIFTNKKYEAMEPGHAQMEHPIG